MVQFSPITTLLSIIQLLEIFEYFDYLKVKQNKESANIVEFFEVIETNHDLVNQLNQSEILVVPSLWSEPFGIVALEGLACGCALLASDAGGLPDAVGPEIKILLSDVANFSIVFLIFIIDTLFPIKSNE